MVEEGVVTKERLRHLAFLLKADASGGCDNGPMGRRPPPPPPGSVHHNYTATHSVPCRELFLLGANDEGKVKILVVLDYSKALIP
nr:unnamed protein product [Callosobruchus analis]